MSTRGKWRLKAVRCIWVASKGPGQKGDKTMCVEVTEVKGVSHNAGKSREVSKPRGGHMSLQ
jgi:hypothetical protein